MQPFEATIIEDGIIRCYVYNLTITNWTGIAKQFYTETYGNDHFADSRSWISNFRKRHGLRSLKVCGEKLSNNQIAIDPVITVLAGKIKELDLTATQIYNADESALYWKIALLIVDNASSHGTVEELTSEDEKFTTIFLPSNCTALLQPTDQNAIRQAKIILPESIKNLEFKRHCMFTVQCLGKVSSEVLQKCWHKILPQVTNNEADSEYEAEELIPLNQLRLNMLSLAEEITDVSDMLNILTEQNQNLTNME
ncbi:hypothetical protein NQ318_010922 [Aromia moschata]|uniref:DDE-1 domain-containing protein n=1 Tax=Aromia moschata TaxID=1265417 RepID=A0AAV8XDX7_9CUCU|nr:hypothetical protein NQ318_010922 [Aromia moschata]